MWNKKIGLYFQLEMNNPTDTFSLAKLAIKRLRQFEEEGTHVDYLELRFTESLLHPDDKKAHIKMDCRGRTFIFTEKYSRWYDMFNTVLDHIHQDLRESDAGVKLERPEWQPSTVSI